MKKQKRKNIKINNKGFSMVEILAVVVILGIVSTIGIVSVTKLIDKSRQHYYDTQEQQLVLAAQAYAASNKQVLPKTIYGVSKIKLQELYDKKYIKDKIKDQNKNNCNPEKTKVEITKISKNDYTYTGYLNCPSCGADEYCKTTTTGDAPTIDILFPSEAAGNNLFNGNSVIKIDMDAKGNNALIGSYSYKIYVNGSLKYDSTLKINNKVATKHIEEKIYKFLPGKVKVVVTVTNTEGKTTSKSKSKDFTDTQFPGCGKISYDGAHAMSTYNTGDNKSCGQSGYAWTNIDSSPGTRQVWVVCNDEKGIGCAQHEFSRVLTTEGPTDTVTIKDANGLSHDCTVLKCIDKKSSSAKIEVFKATSSGGKTGNAICTYTIGSQNSTANYTKDTETCSTWFNKENYPDGVYIKVSVTDTPSNIKSLVWKQNDKNKKVGSLGNLDKTVVNDTSIGSSTHDAHQVIKEDGVRRQHIVITDNAGNKVTGELVVKIDFTPPPKPTISMYLENSASATATTTEYSNNTWVNKYVWVTTNHPTDSPDVSGWKTNQYTTTGVHGENTNVDGNGVHITNEGTSTITFRSCDNAGNCSATATVRTIKLDRTAPDVPTVHLRKWTGSTAPTSKDGLDSWADDKWLSGNIFSYPSGSGESGDTSGLKEYQYTTRGATTHNTDKAATYRNIKAEGTSTIKWRAIDNVGNVSEYSDVKTIKLDRTAPSCGSCYITSRSGCGAYYGQYYTESLSGLASKGSRHCYIEEPQGYAPDNDPVTGWGSGNVCTSGNIGIANWNGSTSSDSDEVWHGLNSCDAYVAFSFWLKDAAGNETYCDKCTRRYNYCGESCPGNG